MKNKKASRLNTWCLFPIVALYKPAGYDQLFLRPALFSSRSDTISIKGNAQPESIPFCISLPAFWVIFPTIAGPSAPPRSPAIARSANIAVPTLLYIFWSASLEWSENSLNPSRFFRPMTLSARSFI